MTRRTWVQDVPEADGNFPARQATERNQGQTPVGAYYEIAESKTGEAGLKGLWFIDPTADVPGNKMTAEEAWKKASAKVREAEREARKAEAALCEAQREAWKAYREAKWKAATKEDKTMVELKFTVDRPEVNTEENHNTRLAQLGLRYGATSVYRDRKGTYWATGDYAYNSGNIDHNIKRMVEIMQAEGLTYMSKAHHSNIYKSKQRIDLNKIETFKEVCRMDSTNRLVAVNPELPMEVVKGG